MGNKKKRKASSGKKRGKSKGKEKYNTKMIRDFLDHLLWELRIAHLEHSEPLGNVNDELVEQLVKYIKKYEVHGLLPYHAMSKGTPEDKVAALHSDMAKQEQKQIDALEFLQPLFEKAIYCASQGNNAVVVNVTGDDHASGSDESPE